MQLATFLEAHPAIESVSYPHLPSHPQHDLAKRQMSSGGSMLAFEVRGGSPAVTAFAESCRVARIAPSLGGPETLITHPATIASRYTPSERADRKSTRLNSSHQCAARMPFSALKKKLD